MISETKERIRHSIQAHRERKSVRREIGENPTEVQCGSIESFIQCANEAGATQTVVYPHVFPRYDGSFPGEHIGFYITVDIAAQIIKNTESAYKGEHVLYVSDVYVYKVPGINIYGKDDASTSKGLREARERGKEILEGLKDQMPSVKTTEANGPYRFHLAEVHRALRKKVKRRLV